MSSKNDASKGDSVSRGLAWLIQVPHCVDGGRPGEISVVDFDNVIEYRTIQHVHPAILDGRLKRAEGRFRFHLKRGVCVRTSSTESSTRSVFRLALRSSFVVPGIAGASRGRSTAVGWRSGRTGPTGASA